MLFRGKTNEVADIRLLPPNVSSTLAYSVSTCRLRHWSPCCPDGVAELVTLSETGEVEHIPGQFLELVDRQDQKLVIVDFWATWCGPCRRLSPSLDKIKKTWGDKVEIVKVDVDQAPQISSYMGASGIPDVRIFRKGTQVADFVGVRPYADIDSLLKSLE